MQERERDGPPGCAKEPRTPRWHANAGRDENPVRAHHASGLAKLRRRRRRWRRRRAGERTLHWPYAGSTVRRQMPLPGFQLPALGKCDLEFIESGNGIIDVQPARTGICPPSPDAGSVKASKKAVVLGGTPAPARVRFPVTRWQRNGADRLGEKASKTTPRNLHDGGPGRRALERVRST